MLKQISNAPNDKTIGNKILRKKGNKLCADELKDQIDVFWRGEYPFECAGLQENINPLDWWKQREQINSSQVLAAVAIKIFSILVNSMPDERTNSTITWLNSPTRGNQSASTLVDMIQIGQWYGKHVNPDAEPTRYRPAVKFRKIDKDTLARLQDGTQPAASQSTMTDANDLDADLSESVVADPVLDDSSDDEDLDKAAETPTQPPSNSTTPLLDFDIDEDVDIDSPALLDMISEKDEVAEEPGPTSRSQPAKAPVSDVYTVDEAFSSWD